MTDLLKTPPLDDRRRNAVGVRGYACETAQSDAGHTNCPGWWPRALGMSDGWTCACACHDEQQRWPGFVDAPRA